MAKIGNIYIDNKFVTIKDGAKVHRLTDELIQLLFNEASRFFWQKRGNKVYPYRIEKYFCSMASRYDDNDITWFQNDKGDSFRTMDFYSAPREGEEFYLVFAGDAKKPSYYFPCEEWELCV